MFAWENAGYETVKPARVNAEAGAPDGNKRR
jgi:hypothetical protein